MDRAIRGHDWTGARSGAVVALVRALADEGPGAAPSARQDRPDWCGRCDETTRMVTDPETGAQPRRCEHCHPLAGVPIARRGADDERAFVAITDGLAKLRASRGADLAGPVT